MIIELLEDYVRNNKKLFDILYPFKNFFIRKKQICYSQFAEDIIIEKFFRQKKKGKVLYFDIGANDPIVYSNTYMLYKKHKGEGILIEPDSVLCKKLKKKRRRDKVINVGIGKEKSLLDFYVFDCEPLNTFSKEEADKVIKEDIYHIKRVDKVPVISFDDVIRQYSNGIVPDFVSLDAEGMEMDILKSINFKKHRPVMFCIETLEYDSIIRPQKRQDIIDFMLMNGYYIYADTRLNTIFVDKNSDNA